MNQFGVVLRGNRRWVFGLTWLTAATTVAALVGHGVEQVRDMAERAH